MFANATYSYTCLLVVAIGLSSCSRTSEPSASKPSAEDRVGLIGAGSTFAAPLYQKWIDEYCATNPSVSIEYDAVGSGEGQSRFMRGRVDFGGSDEKPSDDQLATLSPGAVAIPIASGCIVIAYHSHQLVDGLKLPRSVYVDIFQGKIDSWNDPRIADANPGVKLPDLPLRPIVRLDSSGTTFAFSNHLSAISTDWRSSHGVGKRINWPNHFQKMLGNERVAGEIKRVYGGVGYVEFGTARAAGLHVAKLENSQGEFVYPSTEATQIALSSAGQDKPVNTPDPTAPGSYPIVTRTWFLAYRRYGDEKRAEAIRSFVRWCLTNGQEQCEPIGYVRLGAGDVSQAILLTDQIAP